MDELINRYPATDPGMIGIEAGRSPASGLDGRPGCCTLAQGEGPCQPEGARVPEDSGLTLRLAVTDDHGRNLSGSARGEALADVGASAGDTGSSPRPSVKPRRGVVRPAGLAPNDSAPEGAGQGGGEAADMATGNPRSSNHGGDILSSTVRPWQLKAVTDTEDQGGIAHFDWYAGTVHVDWLSLIAHLEEVCAWCVEAGYGMNGYAHTFEGETHDGARFKVFCGGNNGAAPSVLGSGGNAAGVATLLRSLSWEHHVTRADSAIEFEGEGVWDDLYSILIGFAESNNLAMTGIEDLKEGAPSGRTIYIGSRKSKAFVRCYEKGKQLGDPSSTWVRVELELRPEHEQRNLAATASPDDLWGYSRWVRELATLLVDGFTPEIVRASSRRSTDEFEIQLMKAFKRNRNVFSKGISKYGQEKFVEMLLVAIMG